MNEYRPFNQVPLFYQLRSRLERIRDNVVLPMKKDLEKTRDALKAERDRVATLGNASSARKGPAVRPVNARNGNNPGTGPGS